VKQEKKQYIDGVNNLDYWTGKASDSKRHDFLYYFESRLTAMHLGPWKLRFSTREHYYDVLTPRHAPLFLNLRSDPFESYDSKDSYGHLAQRVSWVFESMTKLMEAHLKTLAEYPPVQGGTSFDMSNIVQEFLRRSKQ
jgi:hypothetical protein